MDRHEEEVVQEAMRQVETHRRRRDGEQALRWIVLFWLGVLLCFFIFPWPLEGPGGKVWAAVHGLCAQRPGHMLTLGQELPLCARDSGIYVGFLLGVVYLLARRRWRAAGRPAGWFWGLLAVVLLLFALDVLNSVADDWFGRRLLYPPDNTLRLASGLLLGLVVAVLLLWVINLAFVRRQVERPVLSHWLDLPGLLAIGAAGGAALASDWAPLYLPLMVLSVGGMVAMLWAANALAILTRTRGKDVLGSLWEGLPPLWWGSVATVAEMALLSWLRYAIGA